MTALVPDVDRSDLTTAHALAVDLADMLNLWAQYRQTPALADEVAHVWRMLDVVLDVLLDVPLGVDYVTEPEPEPEPEVVVVLDALDAAGEVVCGLTDAVIIEGPLDDLCHAVRAEVADLRASIECGAFPVRLADGVTWAQVERAAMVEALRLADLAATEGAGA